MEESRTQVILSIRSAVLKAALSENCNHQSWKYFIEVLAQPTKRNINIVHRSSPSAQQTAALEKIAEKQ